MIREHGGVINQSADNPKLSQPPNQTYPCVICMRDYIRDLCTCLIGPTLPQVFPYNDYHIPNMDPASSSSPLIRGVTIPITRPTRV